LKINKIVEAPSSLEHLRAILALPFMVLIVIPGILWYAMRNMNFNPLADLPLILRIVMGMVLFFVGIHLFYNPVLLFIRIGKGTLAPWNPTKKLIVKGLYRYTRNPMILAVICLLFAESLLLPSTGILIWAVLFFLLNHFYFRLKEEPDLSKRFGNEYLEYKENVPRWFPRLKAWRPENL